MPAYFLDTSVCVELLRGRADSRALPAVSDCHVSMISASELWLGTEKSDRREERQRQLGDFLSVFEPLVFDADSARAYGQIRAYLERQGLSIGPLDLLIAAHARSQGAILLTANIREFRRVPGLKCQVWPIDARG